MTVICGTAVPFWGFFYVAERMIWIGTLFEKIVGNNFYSLHPCSSPFGPSQKRDVQN